MLFLALMATASHGASADKEGVIAHPDASEYSGDARQPVSASAPMNKSAQLAVAKAGAFGALFSQGSGPATER